MDERARKRARRDRVHQCALSLAVGDRATFAFRVQARVGFAGSRPLHRSETLAEAELGKVGIEHSVDVPHDKII